MNGNRDRGRVPPYATKTGAMTPTTAVSTVSKQSTTSAAPSGAEPEEVLRQTLQSAPNSRPGSRASSRSRRRASTSTTKSLKFRDDSFHDDLDDHDEDPLDGYVMRHGFEDEYNSEDYLAVLEQVSRGHLTIDISDMAIGILHVLYRQAT